ncbi:amidase signature enzyme [Neolentinus lepideus HHB14362 ss-1]|uniref:amidase n=1 Tax=Neolentinus lepideus HHB14362 ss-1 TaxID=1314782 RepID=A0A165UAF8_9AGAM|nr:amidase signature enzyme [Neolentinus lepideus HHB14362 ss-1]
MWPFSNAFEAVASSKRGIRDKALATAQEFSQAAHGEIIKATALEIVKRIEKEEWTASQVLEAFIARAAHAQKTTNCVTEVLFETARQEAHALDEEFSRSKQLKGPLHGVPTSFKDHYEIAGVDATSGYSHWANQPCSKDATVVTLYRSMGAIPFVKTNVPQNMALSFECSNPVWGRTLNPWSAKYTCGGSSGGEAALLAMDGAAIGAGSDVGGSLRIPASYSGIYSLRPTAGRVSMEGVRGLEPGFEGIKTTAGPMARTVDEIEVISRGILGVPDAYHTIPPTPWKDVELPKRLRIGYYTDNGFIKASPANKRAVLETVKALEAQGHECVEVKLPGPASRHLEVFVGITTADGYKTLEAHTGPDPKESNLFLATLGPKLPAFVRSIGLWLLKYVIADPVSIPVVAASRAKTVKEYWEWTAKRDDYRKFFFDEVWTRLQLDGMIAPVQALPSLPHGGCAHLSPLAEATILYNVLNYPTGIVPVTRVDPAKDQLTEEWRHLRGAKSVELMIYGGRKPTYNPEAMKGIPIGVQIVGKPWEDEKVVGMMRIVDNALGSRGFGPGSWEPSKFVQ